MDVRAGGGLADDVDIIQIVFQALQYTLAIGDFQRNIDAGIFFTEGAENTGGKIFSGCYTGEP